MYSDIEQKRIEAYRRVSTEIQELYGSVELGGILGLLINELKIPEENRSKFIHVTGDIILGFDAKSKLATLLGEKINLPQDIAYAAAQKILPLLKAVPDVPVIPDADSTLKEKLELRPEGVPIGGAAGQKRENTDPEAVKPLTREELMSALAAKRTMASDIEAMRQKSTTPQPQVGYGAARADGEKPV